MIDIATVETLNHECSGEPKVLTYFECLFINVLCREVFGDTAVICIGQLCVVVLIIKEVIDINIVNITLDALQVKVL
jgi:hypothetical protein